LAALFFIFECFFLKIEMSGKAILGLSRLDYPSAKTGGTVNGWLCYLPDKWESVVLLFTNST